MSQKKEAFEGWLLGRLALAWVIVWAGALPEAKANEQTLKSFGNAIFEESQHPRGGLIEGVDGTRYGTSAGGGTNGVGTVFKLNPDGTGYALLHGFGGFNGDGQAPSATLVLGTDCALYG